MDLQSGATPLRGLPPSLDATQLAVYEARLTARKRALDCRIIATLGNWTIHPAPVFAPMMFSESDVVNLAMST